MTHEPEPIQPLKDDPFAHAQDKQWVLEARGLGQAFGHLWALRNIHLLLRPGERLAIFGPNGAGKTTLVKVLGTILKRTTGELLILGMDPRTHSMAVRSSIGVLSHQSYLYPELTAEENLTFYGRMYQVPRSKDRVQECLVRVGLEHRQRERVRTLSRGMQQRLALARVILHRPRLLLLDEPDTGLDEEAMTRLDAILAPPEEGERTILMTTHNLAAGFSLCQRWAVLAEGQVVRQGRKEDVDLAMLHEVYAAHAFPRA